MFKVDLTEYKGSKQYCILFDFLIKKKGVNKDDFLKESGVSPSTYRKCRMVEQNTGKIVVDKLCKAFDFENVTDEFMEEFEERADRIYNNIYYNIDRETENDLKYIDKLSERNLVIKPIIVLLKLLIKAYTSLNTNAFINENIDLYNEIKSNKSFLNEGLNEIFSILSILFENRIDESYLVKKYKNTLYYFVLSSKLCDEKRYGECLYVSKITEEKLLEEKNYKRLLSLNTKVMHCLNILGNYEGCFSLAHKQYQTLYSFNKVDYEYQYTMQNLMLSAVALKKYKYVKELLLTKNKLYLNEIYCLLISQYYLDKNEYLEYYRYYYDNLSDENKNLLALLNRYLNTKDKNILLNLKGTKILDKTIKVLMLL